MLTLLIGTDWTANRNEILSRLAADIQNHQPNRILLVPELISHDTERRLCKIAGNTCSRFAEVLTFSRLTRRICEWSGCGLPECLDNGGRLVAMASAARQLHGQLKAYASVESRPEFLTGIVDAVDEFKRCCISAEDLYAASKNASGAFAQKLDELSLLYHAYEGICAQGKKDPRDQITWGLEQLTSCDFAQNHVFYIDGFPDFTRQNMAVITHLIANAQDVVISINCDSPGSTSMAFEKPGSTAKQLLNIAKQFEIPTDITVIKPGKANMHTVSTKLFQGNCDVASKVADKLRIMPSESVYDECVFAATQILEHIHQGARYKDISIVCPDPTTYGNMLTMQLDLCGIPHYLAGTDDILEKSVICTVLTALDAALSGFESRDMLRYLKSSLSPLNLEICDKVENYVRIWNIQGRKWLNPWTGHPDGLVDEWSDEDKLLLDTLNEARILLVSPLKHLADSFRSAVKLSDQTQALYVFLNEIGLCSRLQNLAAEMDAAGDNRNAQILNQLWDILLSALEQLESVLGETTWDSETFTRLLRILLSQYDVGTIPPVLDTVTIGPVSAMRCQEVRHLIVVGAAEGTFPKYASTSGVLSDQERTALRQLGLPLTGGAAEGLQIEFSEIFGVFCGVHDSMCVTYPAGQSSFIVRRLLAMAGKEFTEENKLAAVSANIHEAAAYLCRADARPAAQELGIEDLYDETHRKKAHQLGKIHSERVEKLYGAKLNLSASQIDTHADCRLAYFLKYGLRAKEQKSATVDPAEFGTFVHAVLEDTAREIRDLGGFKAVTLDQASQIAQKYADAYTEAHFSQIDSQRIAYLFRRNNQELQLVVEELWKELQESSFMPIDFEVSFGDGAQLSAIQIPNATMPAQLRGFVDRVDAWQEDGRNYYRVVDYKTGRKDFDYCDVLNGLGLQMLLYLFALQEQGESLLGGNPIPAAIQYFPARVPFLSADGELTEEEATAERKTLWKRKGLILGDEDVVFALENTDSPMRLSCKRKKDGTLTGDIATKEQFSLLNRYVFHILGKMVADIASGNVDANPYTRGNSHNACRFCPYGTICHSATVEDRRNYKAVSSQQFWDHIEKEMSELG